MLVERQTSHHGRRCCRDHGARHHGPWATFARVACPRATRKRAMAHHTWRRTRGSAIGETTPTWARYGTWHPFARPKCKPWAWKPWWPPRCNEWILTRATENPLRSSHNCITQRLTSIPTRGATCIMRPMHKLLRIRHTLSLSWTTSRKLRTVWCRQAPHTSGIKVTFGCRCRSGDIAKCHVAHFRVTSSP